MEIKLTDINYAYKKINYEPKEVFRNLNVCLDSNVDCIIGCNGSGKSTLMSIISGDLRLDNGVIEFSKRVKIGYVKENQEFITETIREELIYSMMEHNYKISEKRMLDVLLMVGIDISLIDEKIKKLTSSQKKLLSLAVALIYNPNVLVLDSFTEGLDDINQDRIIKLIRILKNRYNKKIIIASNDLEFIHKIADKVYVLYDGTVIMSGSKYDIFKQEKLLKKYGLLVPNIIKFENLVLSKKNIRLGYRDDINDLIKDIYRNSY